MSHLDAGLMSPQRGAAAKSRRHMGVALRGEPWVWLCSGGLALAMIMILSLLILILINGTRTFWPTPIVQVVTQDGRTLLGQITRVELFRPNAEFLAGLSVEGRRQIEARDGWDTRRLLRIGNYDLYGADFQWIADSERVSITEPQDALIVERTEWGPFIGTFEEMTVDGQTVATGSQAVLAALREQWDNIRELSRRIKRLETGELGRLHHDMERLRLELRAEGLRSGTDSTSYTQLAASHAQQQALLQSEYDTRSSELDALREQAANCAVTAQDVGGRRHEIASQDIVRFVVPNTLTLVAAAKIYLSRWWEFLSAAPREANTEGGVFPAIFGTVLMTLLMSVVVGPFGVIAAVYLREYARQGPIVSAVRVAVGNLAGVPSIVYGIFGLGFFCYGVGGMIDAVWFPERLPAPTYGTTGILWSSLTLALLTVPVVIVATEEALSAVPRSMREGSYACGASRWQTIRRIVLPKALPGIMTGLILAMARGAGEVAPLMITGAVKLAPQLPIDWNAPFFHLQRSFMHLGFHIYDVGFQSRNSEAAKPMVYTTTLLLIGIVAALNLFAMVVRARVRNQMKESHF